MMSPFLQHQHPQAVILFFCNQYQVAPRTKVYLLQQRQLNHLLCWVLPLNRK
uniref:Uncharacterized protein n=1 Tax=Arundo donax TaxID=35708 RepID=A0A0A9P5F8_ARUDO